LEHPLQIYSSALVFAPEESNVRQLFASQIPPVALCGPGVESRWGIKRFYRSSGTLYKGFITLRWFFDRETVAYCDEEGRLVVCNYTTGVHLIRFSFSRRRRHSWLGDLPDLDGEDNPGLLYEERISRFDISTENLLAYGCDKDVRLWSCKKRKIVGRLSHHQETVYSVAFSPDGKLLASADKEGGIILWHPDQKRPICALRGIDQPVKTLAFNSEASFLAACHKNDHIMIWQRNLEWALHSEFQGPERVRQMIWYEEFLILSTDCSITIRDVRKQHLEETHLQPVSGGRSMPDLDYTYVLGLGWVGGNPNGSRLKKPEGASNGAAIFDTLEDSKSVRNICLSSNGRLMAGFDFTENRLKLWDMRTGTLYGHVSVQREPTALSFSPDGHMLAIAEKDVTVWSLVNTLDVHVESTKSDMQEDEKRHGKGPPLTVSLSPDGRMLAAANRVYIDIWDLDQNKVSRRLTKHQTDPKLDEWIIFSAQSDFLALIWRTSVAVWDLRDAQHDAPICVFGLEVKQDFDFRHLKSSFSFSFSPDSKLLAYTVDSRTLVVRRTASGDEIRRFVEPNCSDGPYTRLRYSFWARDRSNTILCFSQRATGRGWRTVLDFFAQIAELDIETGAVTILGKLELGRDPVRTIACSIESRVVILVHELHVSFLDGDTFREFMASVISRHPEGGLDRYGYIGTKHKRLLPRLLTDILTPLPAICGKNRCLLTDEGIASLPHDPSRENNSLCECGLSPVIIFEDWLYWKNRPCLWIPPEYRPTEWVKKRSKRRVFVGRGAVAFLSGDITGFHIRVLKLNDALPCDLFRHAPADGPDSLEKASPPGPVVEFYPHTRDSDSD
jgi:WD40 repeat protein